MLRAVANIPLYIGSYTYATLPSASSYSGQTALASDIGIAPGMMLISDGTRWKPMGDQLLAMSNASGNSHTGDLNEFTFATVTVPAGLMGINGGLRIETTWSYTNSVNTKTLRARLGGASAFAGLAVAPSTTAIFLDVRTVRNRNANNSQIWSQVPATTAMGASAIGTGVTAAIDTSVSQNLLLTGQLSNTGETISLERYEIWALP